jgi:PAS domain S-box-containing protein
MTKVATAAQADRLSGARGGETVTDESGRPASWPGSYQLARGLAVFVVVLALGVLAGWAFGWPLLTSWIPGEVQMKVNAAICLLSLALGLGLAVAPPSRRASRLLAAGLALIVFALAGATALEHFTGMDFGIDQAFAVDTASAISPYPGRFAVQTSIAFIGAALALLVMGRRIRGVDPTEWLGVACGCIGGVGVLGYMFGATELLSLGSATQVSLPASFALTILGVALIAANPHHRLVRLVTDTGAAGQVMRVFLPAAVLVVPVGAWVRLWGERAGLYSEGIGLTIMVAFEALILAAIGAWTTSRVQRLESERAQARVDRDRFFDLTADLVCVFDADGRLLVASPSWQRVLGRPLSEIMEGPFADFVHPDDREVTQAQLGSGLAAETPAQSFQNRCRRADGTYRWLEWNSDRDPDSGHVYAVARDITERRQSQAALARLAAIVESSADGIVAVDPSGYISQWNAGAAAMFGYSAQEAIGQQLTLTSPEGEHDEQTRRWSEAAAGRPQTYESFRRRKDGSQFRALLTLFPISGRDGAHVGVSTIVHDVTDSYEAHQKLERSSQELARSNAELEQFAYVASHDLQEPLRMVTGFMGLLDKKYGHKLGAEADEYIGFAGDGARRMQSLIDDLLTFSRVGSRDGNLVLMDIRDAVTSAEQNLRTLIEETGARIILGDLPTLVADRQLMGQLYQNLIGNAIKFRGEGPPEIELGAERGTLEWRLFVRDHGIGIPAEHREKIFVIFRRLHSREEYPGSGIGLAICRRIVERHGGRIWVDATTDGGSTFWFTLPDRRRDGRDE